MRAAHKLTAASGVHGTHAPNQHGLRKGQHVRCHRMGQHLPVTVYAYRCLGTIEDRIQQVLNQKQALFDELVDGVSMDVGSLLTKEELLALFGLTVPAG